MKSSEKVEKEFTLTIREMDGPRLIADAGATGKVPLQAILSASIRYCERSLADSTKLSNPFARKRALCRSLYASRLTAARLLALLRCFRSSNSIAELEAAKNTIEGILSRTTQSLHSLSKQVSSTLKIVTTPEFTINFVDFLPHNSFLIKRRNYAQIVTLSNLRKQTISSGLNEADQNENSMISYIVDDVRSEFIKLLHEYVPSRIKHVRIHGRSIRFSVPNEYSFTIKVSQATKTRRLSSIEFFCKEAIETNTISNNNHKDNYQKDHNNNNIQNIRSNSALISSNISSGNIIDNNYEINQPSRSTSINSNNSKFSEITLLLVASCTKALNCQNAIEKIDNSLHSFFITNKFLHICKKIKENENQFNYSTFSENGSLIIKFPNSYLPRNTFDVTVHDSGIYLHSRAPMLKISESQQNILDKNDEEFITYNLSHLINNQKGEINHQNNELNNSDVLESGNLSLGSILTEIRDCVFYTRLVTIFKRFSHGISSLSIPFIKCTLSNNTIVAMINNKIAFRIILNWRTGEAIVDFCLYDQYVSLILDAVDCEDFERINILHKIFINFLSLEIFSNIVIGPHCNYISNIGCFEFDGNQRIVYSFAQTAGMIFSESLYRISLHARASKEPISTDQILVLNNSDIKSRKITPLISPAIISAKKAIIIRQMIESFAKNATEVRTFAKSVKAITPTFESIRFSLSNDSRYYWSLLFEGPRIGSSKKFDFKIEGSKITLRFIEWIENLVNILSKYMYIIKQALSVEATHSTVKKITFQNHLNFTIDFVNEQCRSMEFHFQGLIYNHTDSHGVEVYYIDPCSPPKIDYFFSRTSTLRFHTSELIQSDTNNYFIGSLLTVYVVPLQIFYNTFFSDPYNTNWSTSVIKEGCTFILIFKKNMSIFVTFQTAQIFNFLFPKIGVSMMLQIAIASHPNFMRGLPMKGGSLKAHISQLVVVKNMIEDFFNDMSLLEKLRFGKPTMVPPKEHGTFPRQMACQAPSYCPNITCIIDSLGIHIDVNDNGPKFLHSLLNIKMETRKQKQSLIHFLFSILSVGGKGNDFLSALKDIDDMGQPIEWTKTLENGFNLNNKILTITNFVTNLGVFFFELNLAKDEIEFISENGANVADVTSIGKLKAYFKSIFGNTLQNDSRQFF
ncbi:hypothetical protein TRFO_27105 [Tritrichomonas foetus]|uniref:Uncharacterized protein n=1 Tax=Tritrichomonas foetus TaxID=1144522 RepID=A0A1J4K2P0_9EUKA|nr:hypothetical protein TRFO_27105 [Tritrichomonas foetus]|eukprot:OHT05234.1 hypothetical protein TRFO_27105 [Tritrichomonas foetus]